ncbi:MAG: glycosyl hydrolase family 8 [Bacteroidetes bacterium]|nr:glycosyl hydrolase family 8 [Bacteroidota bacterium]
MGKILLLIMIFVQWFNGISLANDGAFFTGKYQNLFKTLLNKSDEEIKSKIDRAFQQLFYGNDTTERVYYPVGEDMAYIYDVWNNDVRTEGMSYGMMIAIQLDRKEEFDRLWKWAKTYMQHKSGQREYYFAWHCTREGVVIDSNSASDGEEWFVTALLFASKRWGDGVGIYNYKAEALKILQAMVTKCDTSDDPRVVTNMFNKRVKQVVFVPAGEADDFTDPSYHVPHFYELWAIVDKQNSTFWHEVAITSRAFLKKVVHPETGLAPDYATFDGKPYDPWGGGHNHFQYDAWRVAMNIAVDYEWFRKDRWAVLQSNRLLKFFHVQGINSYVGLYTLDGKKLSNEQNSGLVAMNAVAALAATLKERRDFVQKLWELPIPSGRGRYYDGMLYLLSLLQVSGNFRIYI